MKDQKLIEEIETLLQKAKTEEALDVLVEVTKNESEVKHENAVLLSGQFKQWKRDKMLGIEQSSGELNRIQLAILTILKEDDLSQTNADVATNLYSKGRSRTKNYLLILSVTFGFLAIILVVWFMGKQSGNNTTPQTATTQTPVTNTPSTNTNVQTTSKLSAKNDIFDSNAYYRLTSKWQGKEKSLDIINDGKNNQPILAKTSNYAGQFWKINKVGADIYTLTTKWQGTTKKLDCIQGVNQNKPVLNETNGTGSAWKIIPVGNEYYRITNMWLSDRSLDIINDGKNNNIQVAKTSDSSGQFWKITKIE